MLTQHYERRINDGDQVIVLLQEPAFNQAFQELIAMQMESEFDKFRLLTMDSITDDKIRDELKPALIRRAMLDEILQFLKYIAHINEKRVNE